MRGWMLLVTLGVALASGQARGEDRQTSILGRTVQPIFTTLVYANGSFQQNRGTGFVVGKRFITAFHNIQGDGHEVARYVELAGKRVEPSRVDRDNDLAVFDLNDELCARWCNDDVLATPGDVAEVTWIQNVDLNGANHTWRTGSVTNIAFKSAASLGLESGCEQNLVVEVDVPFVPGSSGGPVYDARSGAIVGLIQGSFERASGTTTGYFKPVECMLSWLELASG